MKKKVMIFTASLLLTMGAATTADAAQYTVQPGDTLFSIAQEHGTSVDTLKKLNHLSGNTIYANTTLTVPDSANNINSKTPSTYTVTSGDTLYSIAARYGMTVQSIKQLNGLSSESIYVGQTLKLTGQASPSTGGNSATVTVQKGDTLYSIAARHGLSVAALKEMNGLAGNAISVGQTLTINGQVKGITSPAPGSFSSSNVINIAKSYQGVPYVWGGASPSGFDCSGFIYYVFKQAGMEISRTNTEGYYRQSVRVSSPQVGDLVFFSNTYKPGISHMGIYVGNNQFIHASSSAGITISSLSNSYYKSKFTSFNRLR
ncbi:C40 family peptidase [Bacillus thermotolerans]|uniref:C40 family peptidase n=1 Tax=Bacillus thermotolerans TaxID=1221996 RepID=UPI00057E2ADC|nr:C40 family peptidase [Bacillus thermotolerans]KKB37137.1 Membrane-bound lytic murein transglycosylase D precursor [Bacillus thermotolerans]